MPRRRAEPPPMRVKLTYREGNGELWVLKQLRTRFRATIVTDTPRRREVLLHLPQGSQGVELFVSLRYQSWVESAFLTDRGWRRLPLRKLARIRE